MDWLTTRPSPDVANHWLALLSLALFALGVIAAGVLNSRPGLPPFNGNYTRQFVRLVTTVVGTICGVGLFFGIIRLLQIDPATLGRPIWIVLTWVALVTAIAWLVSRAPADRQLRVARRQRSQARKVRV
jgi:hypothetical protein